MVSRSPFSFFRIIFWWWTGLLGVGSSAFGAVYVGTPADYQERLARLQPGDTLVLQAGVYDDPKGPPGLPIFDLHGSAEAPILITGPETGPPAILVGRSTHNTIRFGRASYVTVRNLEVDGRNRGGDGVKAQGISHHITLENLHIHGVGSNQSVVGISTNGAPAWNWVIRGCVIKEAGTGMYLGNSDGTHPFVGGLIERNVFENTIGYNVQIKHQLRLPDVPGIPTGPVATVIRRNIFKKQDHASKGAHARPNLLIGHVPLTGNGRENQYQIYENVFYQNSSGEALLQSEGNVAIYHNVLFNPYGAGVVIMPHNHRPREVFVFQNTVVARARGILIEGGENGFPQVVTGNAVFSDFGIKADQQSGNFTAGFSAASSFLVRPFDDLETWDLFPKESLVPSGEQHEVSWPSTLPDMNTDFNGAPMSPRIVGAYNGAGKNPGPFPYDRATTPSGSSTAPAPPVSIRVH